MIKAVLFDLDGTLINTNPLIMKTFELTLKYFLPKQVYTKERLMDFIGPTLKQTFSSIWEEKTDEMIEYYRDINRKLHDEMVEIYPTVKDGLLALASQNILLGIVSSKKKDMVLHGLKHFQIDQYFKCIVCADDVKEPKPNKEPILMGMNK